MSVKQERDEHFIIKTKDFDQFMDDEGKIINSLYFEIKLPSSLSREILINNDVKKNAFITKYDDCLNHRRLEPAFLDFDSVEVHYSIYTEGNVWDAFHNNREEGVTYEERLDFYCYYLTLEDNGDIVTDYEDGMVKFDVHLEDEERIYKEIYNFIVAFKKQHGYAELRFGVADRVYDLSDLPDTQEEES